MTGHIWDKRNLLSPLPDDWPVSDSHEKVDKLVNSLSDPVYVRKVLQGIKNSSYAEAIFRVDYRYLFLFLATIIRLTKSKR